MKEYKLEAGLNMVHPTHGTGKIILVDPNPSVEKCCTVLFDNGEQHTYSKTSMKKFRDDANTIRLVILGGACVGKSACTVQLTENNFLEDYEPTIGEPPLRPIRLLG